MKRRVVFGTAVQGGVPQKYDTDLHRRTEMATDSPTHTRRAFPADTMRKMMERTRAFKETIKYVLGEGWIEPPRGGRPKRS